MKQFTLVKSKFCEITFRKADEADFQLSPKLIPQLSLFSRIETSVDENGNEVYTSTNYMIAKDFDLFFLGVLISYKSNPIKKSSMAFLKK